MRVLVTGIEGFVGGHLRARLEALGHEVWGTALDADAAEPRVLSADVRDLAAVRGALRASRAEGIVHLAARSSVAGSHADPVETYLTNVLGGLHVLEAARLADLDGPVVLVGSGEVYGDRESPPRLPEETPLAPLSAYAGSKAAQEALGGQYARTWGLRVVLARSFAHTGPGQDERFVFPSFARLLAAIGRRGGRGRLRVGNLAPVRDYLDVRDVAAAYAVLLERGEGGSVVNVCSGEGFALREYLDELVELAGVEVVVEVDPQLVRAVEIRRLVGDPGRLRDLGWSAERTKAEMLRDLLDYWRRKV